MVDVSEVRFFAAGERDRRDGLFGWVGFRLGDLVIDGVALRRTLSGEWRLAFPERRDRQGRRHPYVRPVDDEARLAIEHAVLSKLGIEDATP